MSEKVFFFFRATKPWLPAALGGQKLRPYQSPACFTLESLARGYPLENFLGHGALVSLDDEGGFSSFVSG